MKNNTSKTTALHMAIMLTLTGFSSGPVVAMGFFDAEQNKSLNLVMSDPITATNGEPPVENLKAAEPEITELPDKLTRVFGRTNSENEKVHYSFTAARGQRVMIYNLPTRAEGPDWNVEYKIDKEWTQVPAKHSFISSELPPNQKVLMRISRSPGMTMDTGDSYMVESEKWRATYNTGYWSLSVRGNDTGGLETSPLTQLCSADTVR